MVDRLKKEGLQHESWPATRNPGFRVLFEVAGLRRVVQKVRPDIVHLHSSKAGLAGRLGRRQGRLIFQPHGWSWDALPPSLRRPAVAWERFAAARVDALICVSRDELHAGQSRGLKAPWALVPNGVDLDRFRTAGPTDRAEARTALGLPDGPLVVCVGTIRPAKGQDVLIAAWKHVLERVPHATLLIVGDGPDRAALEDRSEGSVRFVGERSDVERFLTAAEVVAVPSRREGMSLAMLEAMAVGRSIVSTDVSGAREALGTDAGAVVPRDDPGPLAREIVRRLTDPELAAAEGGAATRRAAERYGFDRTCTRILALYEEICRGTERKGRPQGP